MLFPTAYNFTKFGHIDRVGRRWTFLESYQQIQDVVFFYEKLTYSKTFRSTFMKHFQKLGIPQGVVMGTICKNGQKL